MRLALCLFLLAAASADAAYVPSTCGLPGEYEGALCAYQKRQFATAEKALRTIVDRDVAEPQTLRATYFLARTLMKTGRYDEAGSLFIRIYQLDKPFYDSWNCDFLLGECRRAVGK